MHEHGGDWNWGTIPLDVEAFFFFREIGDDWHQADCTICDDWYATGRVPIVEDAMYAHMESRHPLRYSTLRRRQTEARDEHYAELMRRQEKESSRGE